MTPTTAKEEPVGEAPTWFSKSPTVGGSPNEHFPYKTRLQGVSASLVIGGRPVIVHGIIKPGLASVLREFVRGYRCAQLLPKHPLAWALC